MWGTGGQEWVEILLLLLINNNNHTLTTAVQLDFEENTTTQQNMRRKQTRKAGMKGKWGRPRQKRDQEKNEETLV